VAIPPALAIEVMRLLMYVSDEQLVALVRKLRERYAAAEKGRESGSAEVVAHFNRGVHVNFRWKGDEVL
jgi:hypothetical protein